ncbi:hypothetical protein AFLA_138530 [Paecilomyces variotii No. 5]|uniref:Xylanolytic transcriptional activator regulatory domain-containing protein n=1 Tax=Byssochlamys spectabilis (strain No. 5 / NBRC 109023) TaxID=1356009 RepID=V5FWJ5_BYSSN|nr:hypothetical protein AFLA_138530 [Paecilomyces variotii No. 5]
MQETVPNKFPITYFLDPAVYRHCHLEIPKPDVSLPSGILNIVKDPETTRDIANQYFHSFHLWLPIIYRSKFYGSVLQQSLQKDVDLALLVACMKIVLPRQNGSGRPVSRLYPLIKHYFVQLEQVGLLTITTLQAMIILATYEMGHGIYPAAYLTIGSCARYAVALGLDRAIFEWDDSHEWTLMEEKHRVWWAVVILERSMNVNFPSRALCTLDPVEKQYLPLLDEDWNDDVPPKGTPYTVSSLNDEKMGKFARLAQATHLLSRVLRHVSDTETHHEFLYHERDTLDRALRSLLSLTVAEEKAYGLAYCSPVAVLSSALLILHSYYQLNQDGTVCIDAEESYPAVMELTAQVILPIAHRLRNNSSSSSPCNPSPLVLNWMYRSIVLFQGLLEQGDHVSLYADCIKVTREAIEDLSLLWPIGKYFLDLLETRALTNMRMEF